MVGPILYELSVPTFRKVVFNQIAMLKKAQKWTKENNVPESKLLDAKLAPDMLPLPFQIQVVANMVSKFLQRLEILEIAAVPDDEKTLVELIARLEKSLEQLDKAKPEAFAGKEDKHIEFKTGAGNLLQFKGLDYVRDFVLPNIFFHHTIAYSLYRAEGMDVGKRIYLEGVDELIVMPKK